MCAHPKSTSLERLTNAAYTILSLGLVAATMRVISTPTRNRQRHYLLGMAVCVFFLSDFLGTVAYATGRNAGVILVLTVPSAVLFAAAAYHPTAADLTYRPTNHHVHLSMSRMVLLGVSLLVPPVLLVYELAHPV